MVAIKSVTTATITPTTETMKTLETILVTKLVTNEFHQYILVTAPPKYKIS
jgi:hypothetical protein